MIPLCISSVLGGPAWDCFTLRLTVKTMMIGVDNPKRPPLSVIMADPHRMFLKGPLPGYICRCEDVGV